MILVIGSSSKLALEIGKLEINSFFIGRSNPFNLKNWIKGSDLSSQKGIENEIQAIENLLNSTNILDPIHLVFLNGISSNNWEESINVNMLSTAMVSEYFANFLKKKNLTGSIILIGSASTYIGGKIPYSMTKASLNGLMNSLNSQFKPILRVNIVLPGAFVSGMTEDWSDNKIENISKATNQNRIATSGEIADAIMFCVRNNYLSGTTVNMTSGIIKTTS